MTELQLLLQDIGWDFGLVKLEKPLSLELYKNYIDQGFHGEMKYLETHLGAKENPQQLLPSAKSAIVFRRDYVPHPYPSPMPKGLKIASYAKGEDYHYWFRREMAKIIDILKAKFPDDEFICFTDSSPVMERDLAYRAGLGWVGKNSCVISQKKGSLFFIGEIFTSIDIGEHAETKAVDRCGTCTRCIDACPTEALQNNRTMNATKCISYLTIEAKEAPPLDLRDKLSGWYFGCDICQTVCPWNLKAFGKEFFKEPALDRENLKQTLQQIMTSSNRQIERIFQGSALMRANPNSHRRNAILLAVEHQFKDLLEVIQSLKGKTEKLEDLISWAEERLS